MDIDIHITNATPEDIKKAFQAIAGSKERQDDVQNLTLEANNEMLEKAVNRFNEANLIYQQRLGIS
ncbi:hypothetical protein [Lacticaseibacillus paracasei]